MPVMQRIGREYLAQIFAFAVTLLDRVVTAAVLVRVWGTDGFAAWTVAMSAAGLMTIFDLGFAAYFSNRLTFALEQGDRAQALRMFRIGNACVLGASLAGAILVSAGFWLTHGATASLQSGSTLVLGTAMLVAGSAARQAVAVVFAAYRAHRQFFRQTMVTALADLIRMILMIVAALTGGGLLIVSVVFLAAMLVFSVALPLIDTWRLFPAFAYGVVSPDQREARQIAVSSSLYWVQSLGNTAITYVPVLFLAYAGATGLVLAQFALMRTLANLVRTVLQLFANVMGLEAARRIAVGDARGLSLVYRESGRFLAVQTAASAGLLVALSPQLFLLWTGQEALYDPMLLWLAIGTPLILPTLSLAVQLTTCANIPKPLAQGRLLQMALTVTLLFVLPIDALALRLMTALALGELIGLGVPLTLAVRRTVDGTGLVFHIDFFARSVVAALVCGTAAYAGALAGKGTLLLSLACGLVSGALAIALVTVTLGIGSERRQSLLALAKDGLARRRVKP